MPQTTHRSTSRVLDIFDLLSTSIKGYTLTEIAKQIDSPKSSLLPILQTLVARGYLEFDYRTNLYTLGLNLYVAASIYRNKVSVNKFIDMEMRYLTDCVNESCCLAILEGKEALFLHRTDPANAVYCQKVPGKTELACIGAFGKSLLCDYKLDDLIELFFRDGGRLPAETSLYQAHIQMEGTRVTRLSYEYGEVEAGIQCIASPIRLDEKVVAAIGIILPTFRLNPDKTMNCVEILPVAVQKIENILSTTNEKIGDIFSLNGFKNL